MTPFQTILRRSGVLFKIERNGTIISTLTALPNHEKATSRKYIGFPFGSDVKVGDWLISPADERFYVSDITSDYFQGVGNQLKAFYQTVAEYNTQPQTGTTVFNIGTATGSVIGTQSYVTFNYNDSIQNAKEQIATSDSPDKEELQQIISLLEMVVNNQVPVQKGLFSKFSSVMERNSWISGTIASTLLNWLTLQIH